MIRIVVYGQPAPQGSKKFVGMSKSGHAKLVEHSKRVKPWREAVKDAALAVRFGEGTSWTMLDGPLSVRMVFTFHRPQSHYRSGKNAALLKPGAPSRPMGAPDLSKLIRSTEDALTDAGIWRDDSRVVEYTNTAKVYVGDKEMAPHYLLQSPGVVIEIRTEGQEAPF